MPRAHLTVTIPEGIWIGDVSRTYPDAQFRVLAALADGQAGVGLAEITAQELSSILAEVDASEAVTELDILQQHNNTALIQFETMMPLLLFSIQGAGVPLEMPFLLTEGTVEWELTASQGRLSELGRQFEQFGIPFTVNEVQQHFEPEQLLTDRQLELLSVAVEAGYYNTLRECSLTELADELGIAKSTCSETLHRAEGTVIKQFVGGIANATIETETS
ncbi:MAG TPA: helix-turn-helix domain-containing protein [Halococcus sp.]|nr:helix-turn-helix domain-containing protein [Halococcus sp.]